jgi:hypothetical protein
MDTFLETNDANNVYARNVEAKVIHVSEASSGRRGYYCLGCDREMQAVISTKSNRISYFRHDAQNVDIKLKCTYSDETYRHKLAKEILQRIKSIKVPPLYKYPPKGVNGVANFLNESETIEAFSVGIEVCFYEDENGEIQSGRNGKMDNKFLLIQPDVTFFNKDLKPILFIELVATHGIKQDKLIKIKRLGIDTIQVNIPKSSPEDIENAFYTTDKTKWVYNERQERTEYIQFSGPNTEGISPIDELQSKLFEETFECRAAQIRNLIRSIEKCVESKPYADIERGIRLEISRVETNTERYREDLTELRRGIQNRVNSEFSDRRKRINDERKRIAVESEESGKRYSELEERYIAKRDELDGENRVFELDRTKQIESLNGGGRIIIRQAENEERDIDESITRVKLSIERIQSDRNEYAIRIENLRRQSITDFENNKIRGESEIGNFESDKERLPEQFERDRVELETKYGALRKGLDETVDQRNITGNNELSRRIKRLLETRRLLLNYEEVQRTCKRKRTAWECFKSGDYKNWKE